MSVDTELVEDVEGRTKEEEGGEGVELELESRKRRRAVQVENPSGKKD